MPGRKCLLTPDNYAFSVKPLKQTSQESILSCSKPSALPSAKQTPTSAASSSKMNLKNLMTSVEAISSKNFKTPNAKANTRNLHPKTNKILMKTQAVKTNQQVPSKLFCLKTTMSLEGASQRSQSIN